MYNLVGFSGCLHLWWITLLNPELLNPELCVTSVTMNRISLTTSTILKAKQALTIQNQENHPTLHCLAQHLAQAGGSRSGEMVSPRRAPSSPRRGLEKGAEALAGSRLGETPFTWARCSLAQKPQWVAWATIRGEKA
ncbi:hypothetical protein DEO72_LG8g2115 [Vigna unguiculata]|uniref:Uncharacterized protein n=1 Tax=Vigna unguiculata TaxID=3917 RepID=A0A4D6MTY3_VIGUN|nr:hypothetical protein DEO72_LG8g2115 [Vigna unguiculata]